MEKYKITSKKCEYGVTESGIQKDENGHYIKFVPAKGMKGRFLKEMLRTKYLHVYPVGSYKSRYRTPLFFLIHQDWIDYANKFYNNQNEQVLSH